MVTLSAIRGRLDDEELQGLCLDSPIERITLIGKISLAPLLSREAVQIAVDAYARKYDDVCIDSDSEKSRLAKSILLEMRKHGQRKGAMSRSKRGARQVERKRRQRMLQPNAQARVGRWTGCEWSVEQPGRGAATHIWNPVTRRIILNTSRNRKSVTAQIHQRSLLRGPGAGPTASRRGTWGRPSRGPDEPTMKR